MYFGIIMLVVGFIAGAHIGAWIDAQVEHFFNEVEE